MSDADSARRDSDESISLFKAALLLFALLFVLLVLAFGTDRLLRTDNFPVRNVRFEGEFKHVTQQELQAAVMSVVHGNFFLLNLDAVKARVESLPWVYKASVRRQWPQDVYVRFTEQQLAAYWSDGAFLNQAGDVVRVKADDLPAEFPRLEGPEGTGAQVLEHYKSLGRILAAAGLKLERVILTPRRTWRLVVTNGDGQGGTSVAGGRIPGATMTIVLDREQPERKLERFARVYVQSFALLASDIRQVDLRYANGFSVEQAGGQTAGHHDAPGRTSIGRAAMDNKG
ncbi:MAG: FtsQ-type POTRA domain-containing protein [Sulfuricaulis sp.]|uniref:cell division protein FtsQ/DivIB n=1 Tax=Sulfuricaulis sp. TaxID=2003553 RepID=UPI003C4877A6